MKRIFKSGLCFLLSTGLSYAAANAVHHTTSELPILKSSASAPPVVLSLMDAIALAIRNNPTLVQAKLSRITDKLGLLAAENAFEPTYSFTAGYSFANTMAGGPSQFSRSSSFTPGVALTNHYGTTIGVTGSNTLNYTQHVSSNNPLSYNQYQPNITVTVTQQLLKGSSRAVVDANLNIAKDAEIVNKLGFQTSVNTTLLQVVNDYFALIQAQLALEVDQETEKNYELTAKNDALFVEAGQQPKSNLIDAQATVANQKVTVQSDTNTLEIARQTLLQDIGLKSSTSFALPSDLSQELHNDEYILTGGKQPPSLEECQQYAIINRPDYQTAVITLRDMARSLMTTKDAARWNLALEEVHQQGGLNSGSPNGGIAQMFQGHNASDAVTLTATSPISTEFANKQNIINAKVSLQNAVVALDQARRSVYSTVFQNYNTLKSQKEELTLSEQALVLQRKNVDNADQLHKVGNISTFELVSKQQTLASTEASFVQAKIAYLNDLAAFDQGLNVLMQRFNIELKY
jgi:outer membrane protein